MLVVRDFTGNVFQPTALEGPQDLSQWGSFNLDFLQEAVGALTHDDEFSPSSSSSFPHEDVVDPLPGADDVTAKPEPTPAVLATTERARKRTRRRGFQLPASTRQKNRAAQQRFRLRQKARQEEMVTELEELRSENSTLKEQLAAMEKELQALRSRA